MRLNRANLVAVLIAVFCLIWSSAFAIGRAGVLYAPPLTLLTLRFFLAAMLASGLALILRQKLPRGRALVLVALIGIVNHAVYLGLSYLGMRHVPAGLTAIIISANPVATTLLAAWLLDEGLHWRKLLGLALGVLGVAFILRHRLTLGLESPVDLLWPVGALLALSGGTVLYKRWGGGQGGAGGFAVLAVQLWAAGFSVVVPALCFEGGLSAINPTPTFWGSLVFQATAASLGAYWIWFYLLRHGAASAVSSWNFLTPPLGVLFGWLLLDEQVAWVDLAGIAPVALGILLVTRQPVPPPVPVRSEV